MPAMGNSPSSPSSPTSSSPSSYHHRHATHFSSLDVSRPSSSPPPRSASASVYNHSTSSPSSSRPQRTRPISIDTNSRRHFSSKEKELFLPPPLLTPNPPPSSTFLHSQPVPIGKGPASNLTQALLRAHPPFTPIDMPTTPPPSSVLSPLIAPNTSLIPTVFQYSVADPNLQQAAVLPVSVAVTGSFNNWRTKIPLTASSGKAVPVFSATIPLPPGHYQFKFVVDDEWKCAPGVLTMNDNNGNLVNYVHVDADKPAPPSPVLGSIPELASESCPFPLPPYTPLSNDFLPNAISIPPESPPGSYSDRAPTNQSLINIAASTLHSCSPFTNSETGTASPPMPTGAFAVVQGSDGMPMLEPPDLPAHLTKVVLNQVRPRDSSLPIPPHVALNHLCACSIKDGVMAVAISTRYRAKAITTITYRPVTL